MIYKTLSRHTPSYGSLINYISKPSKGKDGKPPVVVTHNFRNKTDPQAWIEELKLNESFRRYPRAQQTYIFHEIISFSKFENPGVITEEMLHDFAQKFIELRGQDSQLLYAIHDDTEHKHIHFAISGVKYRLGMANRMSKNDLKDIKDKLQEHQLKYPELQHSNPVHGKGVLYLKDAEWQIQKRTNRTLAKANIQEKVKEIYNSSQTRTDFLNQLMEIGLHHYQRGDKIQGLVDESGTKFRFSRLDVEFDTLPIDIVEQSQEERILEEIQSLRAEREQKYQLERDDMDFSRFIHMNPNSLFE